MNAHQMELGWGKEDAKRIVHIECREMFRAVKKLINKPKKWVQRFGAVDKDGYKVSPTSPDACAWCLAMAMQVGATGFSLECQYVANRIMDNVLGEFGFARCNVPVVTYFNDHDKTTHYRVMQVLDRCITYCSEVIDAKEKTA